MPLLAVTTMDSLSCSVRSLFRCFIDSKYGFGNGPGSSFIARRDVVF